MLLRDSIEERVTRLFEANYERLLRYVARLLGCTQEAEDIVQQTFLKLYTQLMQRRNIKNPDGWLTHTARNLAIDYLRKQHARLLVDCPLVEIQDMVISPNDPVADLLQKERIQCVCMILAAMPPQERACLKLRARGLSYKEIAAVLHISINTVGPTLAHGLRKLRAGYVAKGLSAE